MRTSADYQNGTLTISFFGELDHYAASSALRAVELSVEEYMPRQCVLDFSGLSFMDSSGIAVILKAQRLLRQAGGDVSVQNAGEQVLRVLKLSGLGSMISSTNKNFEECETT